MPHLLFVLGLVLISFFSFSPAFASCEDTNSSNLDERIEECKKKLTEIAGQRKTLSVSLSYFNAQINLTKTKIAKTQQGLNTLKEEIDSLTHRIGRLNTSLDTVSTTLLHRVRETYIRSQEDPVYVFFASSGFQDFVNRYKYLQTLQSHDKEILIAMERIRSNYNVQKTEKQEKQEEMKILSEQLKIQNASLAAQQQEKQQLLEITKNDEKKYQQLLAEALAQKRAFNRFVTSQGGAPPLSGQTKCDDWGCYYNQRDAQWGQALMGNSSLTLAEYGCLVSSVAMIGSHNGKNFTPADIAALSSAFFNPNFETALLLHSFDMRGIRVNLTSVSVSRLDDELNAGRPIIAGLYAGPDHFIVIKKKTDAGYIMNDPFLENGSDRPLTDRYNVSDITSLRLVNFN